MKTNLVLKRGTNGVVYLKVGLQVLFSIMGLWVEVSPICLLAVGNWPPGRRELGPAGRVETHGSGRRWGGVRCSQKGSTTN